MPAVEMASSEQGAALGETAGCWAGIVGGAELGARFVPVPFLGPVAGAVVGALAGSEVGRAMGRALGAATAAFLGTLTDHPAIESAPRELPMSTAATGA
jgi:phage tail tape-measure protein